jgi:hypothetical protein
MLLPGWSRSPHSASRPLVEMLMSVASAPCGEMRSPVIDGMAEAGRLAAQRLSLLAADGPGRDVGEGPGIWASASFGAGRAGCGVSR